MDKGKILNEIKRTAEANKGVPLGSQRFETETGIKQSDWFGVYWARWGDAVREAGVSPDRRQEASDKQELLERYAKFTLELGRLPAKGDLLLRRRSDSTFPNEKTFGGRFGGKDGLIAALLAYSRGREGYEPVARLCERYSSQ